MIFNCNTIHSPNLHCFRIDSIEIGHNSLFVWNGNIKPLQMIVFNKSRKIVNRFNRKHFVNTILYSFLSEFLSEIGFRKRMFERKTDQSIDTHSSLGCICFFTVLMEFICVINYNNNNQYYYNIIDDVAVFHDLAPVFLKIISRNS